MSSLAMAPPMGGGAAVAAQVVTEAELQALMARAAMAGPYVAGAAILIGGVYYVCKHYNDPISECDKAKLTPHPQAPPAPPAQMDMNDPFRRRVGNNIGRTGVPSRPQVGAPESTEENPANPLHPDHAGPRSNIEGDKSNINTGGTGGGGDNGGNKKCKMCGGLGYDYRGKPCTYCRGR